MSYSSQNIRVAELSKLTKIPIPKQSEIVEKTGSSLDLANTYAVIKEASKGFTIDDPTVKNLDNLFNEYLTKMGFYEKDAQPQPTPSVSAPTGGDDEAKAKRVRVAKAKAKAAASRIRILTLN